MLVIAAIFLLSISSFLRSTVHCKFCLIIEVLVTLTMCFCMLAMHPVAALMEFCYRRRLMNPAYELIENCGPAHRKTFKYKVLS